ncbi:50S ribosomal protein L11 methyltransferase [uncultured Algimonas sp.]|uniref:50S ribosomal protein L11 methyltransferase n=1 Tax=uncultured Algimonas sp. TaxID=1547920 RepID=UPI002632E6FE|nr:50S ribosomal protein L11 methyltransferase [uncultured Algimonas sp.]
MSRPFALAVRTTPEAGYALAETLGFDDMTEALSVSIFDDGPDRVHIQALYETKAHAEAASATIDPRLEFAISQVPNEDWVRLSQSGLAPVMAGRFAIHGSHDTPPRGLAFPIQVDAGQAFGTGHHGTTQSCLLMLDELETSGAKPGQILDLGTGAGVLAIAAAKLFPEASILATDIDPMAIEVAISNAMSNDVSYESLVADGFEADSLRGRTFDLIIANILAGPLRELAPDIAGAISPDGQAILSGILDEQAQWVADAFRKTGLTVQSRPSLGGWTSLWARP